MFPGFGEIVETLRRSTVLISDAGQSGAGSGVLIDGGHTVVTNAHVARSPRLQLTLWDGRKVEGRTVKQDRVRDLAVIEVPQTGSSGATLGESTKLRPGEIVIAVGNPLGFVGALTTGVVHAVGPLAGLGRHPWIQADVRLAPGNSGGPLADARGRVVGINTMIAGGLGLAVPSEAVSRLLRAQGSPPSLGVVLRPVPLRRDSKDLGLLVLEIEKGSPAAGASLLPGDLLTHADGRAFESVDDLGEAIGERDILRLRFVRGGAGASREVTVRLARSEAEAA